MNIDCFKRNMHRNIASSTQSPKLCYCSLKIQINETKLCFVFVSPPIWNAVNKEAFAGSLPLFEKKHHTNCASAFNAELNFSVPRPAHKSLDQKWKVKYGTGKAFKSKNQCKGWLLSINSKIWQCADISWHKPLNSCSWSVGSNGVFVSRSSWKQSLLSSVLAGQIMDIGRRHISVTYPSILGQSGPDQSEGVRQIYLESLLCLCRGKKDKFIKKVYINSPDQNVACF